MERMIRWDDTKDVVGTDVHNLYFSHHREKEKMICCLFRGEETREWLYTSDLLNGFFTKLFTHVDNEKICDHDAKLEIQEMVYSHYENEMNYYKEILEAIDN